MIDPITLSVVRSGLEQICNEMDQHLIRVVDVADHLGDQRLRPRDL